MSVFLTLENLVIVVIAVILFLITKKLADQLSKRHNNLVNNFLFNTVKVAIFIVAVLAVLSQHPQFGNFFKVLGTNSALLVATIGFTLQNTLKNVIAGTILISSDTFKIGDRVRIPEKDVIGEIEELTLRHTIIKLTTNERAIVPNTVMNEAVVINNDIKGLITSYPMSIIVKPDVDINLVIEIIEDEILKNDVIINKELSKPLVAELAKDYIEIKTLISTVNIEESFNEISNLRLAIIKRLQTNHLLS